MRNEAERTIARQDIIERLDLSALTSRYPADLSGGQQQRVALARALATDPDVLLLDEPFSALDAPLRRELSGELSQTLREWGKLAVLVTHDLPEAYQIADMVVLYEHGSTTGAVSKNDLLWNPSSERVARLIGARNILRATIADASGDSIVLDWRGGRLEAARSPSHPLHARAGDPLAFFVRPEYVRLIRKNRPVTDGLRQTNLFTARLSASATRGRRGCCSSGWRVPDIPARAATISRSKFRSSSTSGSASQPIAIGTCRSIQDPSRFFPAR